MICYCGIILCVSFFAAVKLYPLSYVSFESIGDIFERESRACILYTD